MSSLAGSFLVARPTLQDASFRQTVILLLQHTDEGAFGLVVNRQAQVDGAPFPLFSGGPCSAPGLFMLHGHEEWAETEEAEGVQIAPGIYLGDPTCAERVADAADMNDLRFRMFTGYAGWGPDQLEWELSAGAWLVVDASAELLFETPAELLWDRLSPPSIPQFSVN
ncbi:MAG: YqgE/AlgH family protein [Gemmataceae bacterium]